MAVIGEIAQAAMGVLLVVSGVLKLRDPALAAFAVMDNLPVRHYRLAHGWLAGSFECIVGAGLVVTLRPGGLASRVAGLAALVLFAAFMAIIARRLRSGDDGSCGCFSQRGERHLSGFDLLRIGLFVGLAGVAAAAPHPQRSWSQAGYLSLSGLALFASGAVVAAVLRFGNSDSEPTVKQIVKQRAVAS